MLIVHSPELQYLSRHEGKKCVQVRQYSHAETLAHSEKQQQQNKKQAETHTHHFSLPLHLAVLDGVTVDSPSKVQLVEVKQLVPVRLFGVEGLFAPVDVRENDGQLSRPQPNVASEDAETPEASIVEERRNCGEVVSIRNAVPIDFS